MKYDLVTYGRASIDLYSKNIGAAFNDIKELSTAIGGCPVNIAVGAQRLGLKTAIVSAVGPDPVGDFIKNRLQKEKVSIEHVQTIEGTKSTAVVCAMMPPNKFPLVFYRDNAPDDKISIDHVNTIDFKNYQSFLMSGNGLAVEPSRSAAFFATEKAIKENTTIFLDLDFRAISWKDVRSFGITLRRYMPLCQVVIGTVEELLALDITEASQVVIKDSAITAPEIQGDLKAAIKSVLDCGVQLLLVKDGPNGVVAYHADGTVEKIPGFPVNVVNVLGAGDAFAAGFIFGYTKGWSTYKAARLANACGAWLVTKNECCNDAPYFDEIINFIEEKGGF